MSRVLVGLPGVEFSEDHWCSTLDSLQFGRKTNKFAFISENFFVAIGAQQRRSRCPFHSQTHQSLKAGQCMLCRRILQSLDHGVHCLLHLRVGHMSALCLMMDVIIASFGLKCQNVVRSLATICPYAGMG